jgi:hypothetical protein
MDGAYPGNPEFSFKGDAGGASSADSGVSYDAAFERNAERFAAPNSLCTVGCAAFAWTGSSFASGKISGAVSYPTNGANAPADGVLVKVERAPVGTGCAAPISWSALGTLAADGNGNVSYSTVTSGVYRFTLIPPRECASLVLSSCATVP